MCVTSEGTVLFIISCTLSLKAQFRPYWIFMGTFLCISVTAGFAPEFTIVHKNFGFGACFWTSPTPDTGREFFIYNCHARSTSSLLFFSLSHHISKSVNCASSSAHLWMKAVAVWCPFILMWKEFLVSLQFQTNSPTPIDYRQYKYRDQGLAGQRMLCSSDSTNIVAGVWETYFDPKTIFLIVKQMKSVKWNQLSSLFFFLKKMGAKENLSFLTLP